MNPVVEPAAFALFLSMALVLALTPGMRTQFD